MNILHADTKQLIRSLEYFLKYGASEPDSHEPRTNIDSLINSFLLFKKNNAEIPFEFDSYNFAISYQNRGSAFKLIHNLSYLLKYLRLCTLTPIFKKDVEKLIGEKL